MDRAFRVDDQRSLSASKPSPWGSTSRGECQLVTVDHAVFAALAQGEGESPLRVRIKVLQTRVGEEFDT